MNKSHEALTRKQLDDLKSMREASRLYKPYKPKNKKKKARR